MTHEHYMKAALREAEKAYEEGEVPVGAIVVVNDRIISRGYNMVEKLKDPTAHAEIIALTSAFNALGAKYIPEATLYVTVEPCLMCAGALHWSKVGTIVWGAAELAGEYFGVMVQYPGSSGRLTQLKPIFDAAHTVNSNRPHTRCAKALSQFDCGLLSLIR